MPIGVTSKPYISATNFLDNREIYRKIIDNQMDDQFLDLLHDAKRVKIFNPGKEASSVPVYHSFYDDELYQLVALTGSTVTGSGTASITVTGLNSANQNKVVVGDLLRCAGGEMLLVTAVTSSGFSARTVDGSNATVVNTHTLSIGGNAQEEKSTGSAPRRWGLNTLSNRIQIFNTAIKITDVQDMSGVEVEVGGQRYILPYQFIRGLQRHRGDISLSLLVGRISDTLFSDSSPGLVGPEGYGVQTTRGLDQYVSQYGINTSFTTPGLPTLLDFTDLEARLVARRAKTDYLALGSQAAIAACGNFFKNLGSSGVNSVRLCIDGRELDLEVDKVSHGGFTFQFKMLNILSNTSVINFAPTGGATTDISRSIYFVPAGTVSTYKEGDVPAIRLRYMKPQSGASGGANRTVSEMTVETRTGNLAPIATDREKALTIEWQTNMGLEIFRPQTFAKVVAV